jgi:hypothetical protein
MAQIFNGSDGRKYILPDNPEVFQLNEAGDVFVVVKPYTQPAEVLVSPVTSLDATGDSVAVSATADDLNFSRRPQPAPATVNDLVTYGEHNGDEPHADPAMRCQCAACQRVGR